MDNHGQSSNSLQRHEYNLTKNSFKFQMTFCYLDLLVYYPKNKYYRKAHNGK